MYDCMSVYDTSEVNLAFLMGKIKFPVGKLDMDSKGSVCVWMIALFWRLDEIATAKNKREYKQP